MTAPAAPRDPGLGRATAVMASGTAVSRVLGVLRTMLLTVAIGTGTTGPVANAFDVANKLPNLLYLLIAGGVLNSVLVPQVVRALKRHDGQDYIDRLVTLAAAILAGLTVVITAAAPLLVGLFSDFADPRVTGLATVFALWLLPQVLFYGLYALFGQVLNARGSFGPYMWAPVVNNLVAMAGLVVFIAMHGGYRPGTPIDDPAAWTTAQVALLAGTTTLGVVAQAAILLPALRRAGIRLRPRWGFRGMGLRATGGVASWMFAGVLVGQLGVIVLTQVSTAAGGDGAAGNTVYTVAMLIFMLPHSLVTTSLVTALFTRLARSVADSDPAGVRRDLSFGLRVVALFTAGATAGMVVLAPAAARVVFPTAGMASVRALAEVIVAMALGLVAFGALAVVQRVFYAYEDGRGLFPTQVAATAVIAAGAWAAQALLPQRWWVVGVATAMTLSYLVGVGYALALTRRRLGGVDGTRVLRVHVRTVAAAVAAALVGWAVTLALPDPTTILRAVVQIAVAGPVVVVVYLAALAAMRVAELGMLATPVLARLPRRVREHRTVSALGARLASWSRR